MTAAILRHPGLRAMLPALFAIAAGLAEASPPAELVKGKGGVDDPKGAGAVSSGVALPAPPPVTGNRKAPVASWGKPLPYPILIADRRNNRLLEVTPDRRIVWEFPSPNLTVYSGNEDVNFSKDGRRLAVSEEDMGHTLTAGHRAPCRGARCRCRGPSRS